MGLNINRLDLEHPGYIPGRFYHTWPHSGGSGAASTAIAAIDTIYLYAFRLFYPILLKSWMVRTITAGAGSSMKSALYWASPVSNKPLGPLVVDNTGVTTQANNTNITVDVTDTPLGPGWYWFGAKFTGTLPTMLTCGLVAPTFQHCGDVATDGGSVNIATGFSVADTYSSNMKTLSEAQGYTLVGASHCPMVALGV